VRIVILAPSIYSETACAMAAHLAATGHVPVGAIALSASDRRTLMRKIGQWGARRAASYARSKLLPARRNVNAGVNNPYLLPFLEHDSGVFRNLRELAALYGFPLAIRQGQNAPESISTLREWSPDLIVFTGGNILRQQVLDIPRLGVINVHLGLLPEVRGMSSPEWSLLQKVPLGITIHNMDAGIDTGPVLQRFEFPNATHCESVCDLRNRLIAFGVEKVAEVVCGLDQGTISATPQSDPDKDNQFFVMHEWLQARAAACLTKNPPVAVVETVNG
jgi:hypothetical protein